MKAPSLSAWIVFATAWLAAAVAPAAAQRTCTITVDGTARRPGEYTVATEMGLPQPSAVDFRQVPIAPPSGEDAIAAQIAAVVDPGAPMGPMTGVLDATSAGDTVTITLANNASLTGFESKNVVGVSFDERPCLGAYGGGTSKARILLSVRRIRVRDNDRRPRRFDWTVQNVSPNPLPAGFQVDWNTANLTFVAPSPPPVGQQDPTGQSSGNLGGLAPGQRVTFIAHARITSDVSGVIERGRAWARPNMDPALDDPALDPLELRESVTEDSCLTGPQPAATLLYPYFEVDLDDRNGVDTFISVNNASDECTLARLTLWTDLGVPTLTFYVYLSPKDVQSISLRRVLDGTLPATSDVLSDLQCPVLDFLPCQPEELDFALAPDQAAALRADHTGAANPSTGACAGSDRGNAVAVGYVTADTTDSCTFPPTVATHTLYQQAINDPETPFFAMTNHLWGDYFYVDMSDNFAQSEPAVHVVADPARFRAGDYTFYGRYTGFDASDARVPLSSAYAARFLNGGVFDGTDLIVWRDNRSPDVSPADCRLARPLVALGQRSATVYDENENAFELGHQPLFPVATQRVRLVGGPVDIPVTFGWLELDLWHDASTPAQAWVTPVISALGRFSVGHAATRLDDLCGEPAAPGTPPPM